MDTDGAIVVMANPQLSRPNNELLDPEGIPTERRGARSRASDESSDPEGITAISRWLSAATPPEPRRR